MTEYTFKPLIAERIKDRVPFDFPDLEPFTAGYRTLGGTYVLASRPLQNDDGKPHDLVAILADDQIVRLRFTASDTLIHAVKDALGIEWRRCPESHPKGYGQCMALKGHIERRVNRRHITLDGAMFGGDLD